MTISASNVSNAFIKSYLSQIKNQNDTSTTSVSDIDIDQEKLAQSIAFEIVLQQMIDSMGSSEMSDIVSTALAGDDGLSSYDSLDLMGSFNSNIRSLTSLDSSTASYNSSTALGSLGSVASKYESSMDPGAIGDNAGDYGGKSYGAWQFSSKTGSLDSFMDYLKETDAASYYKLSAAKIKDGDNFGSNFDAAWKSIASTDKQGFLSLQQQYIGQNYYEVAADKIKDKLGFDISTRSDALKESLWSTAVQHGTGGAVSIFSKLNLNASDESIINQLYDERQNVDVYFKSSSESVQRSVYNRFASEREDMLALL